MEREFSLLHGLCVANTLGKGYILKCTFIGTCCSFVISTIRTSQNSPPLSCNDFRLFPQRALSCNPKKRALLSLSNLSRSMPRLQLKHLASQLHISCFSPVSNLKRSHTLSTSVALASSPSLPIKPHLDLQRRHLATFRTMAPQLDGYFKQ